VKRFEQKKKVRYEALMKHVKRDVEKKQEEAQEKGEEFSAYPESARLYALLWDDTQEVRTTHFGIPADGELYTCMESLMASSISKELKEAIEGTKHARRIGMRECTKDEADFFSGEKLREKVELCEDRVMKNLGEGYVDAAQVKDAKDLLNRVSTEQRKNIGVLLAMLAPAVYPLIIAVLNVGVSSILCMKVYGPALFEPMAAAAARGEPDDVILYHIVVFVIGHYLVWFFEYMSDVFSQRAQGKIGSAVRNGVMKALLSQDYEFFDKTPSGILQERLNTDAEKLADNLINLPKRIISGLLRISLALVMVYNAVPATMFYLSIAPLPIVVLLQRKTQKWQRRMEDRKRKITEEASSSTAEVLTWLKTVRQFSNERHEAANFARCEVMGTEIEEDTRLLTGLMGRIFGITIIGGLGLTMFVGAGYVKSGLLSSMELTDVSFKINFMIVFPARELIEELPKLTKLFVPFGRVCDLLQASPNIEDKEGPFKVVCNSSAELSYILNKCETVKDPDNPRSSIASNEVFKIGKDTLPKGAVCVTYEIDGEEMDMLDTDALFQAALTFPMSLNFARKKVPFSFKGHIEFQDVHFSYPTDTRKPVLQGLSFTVEPGKKVALVGEAGCGKSSCMGLVQRMYDPINGVILIDGVPMTQYNVQELRRRVVLVDQKPVLFAATVRDNIIYGLHREVSDDEVIKALNDASMWEGENGIKSKPDGILTKLGSGGISLSGGQNQRVSIARVMIRNPDVILLDEATSALDNKNEKIVQEALDKLARRGSALVIAHRLTTIKDSDKIVVVRKGRLAEEGTHAELLQVPIVRELNEKGEYDVVSGIYRFLWELQFAKDNDEEEMTIANTLLELERHASEQHDGIPTNEKSQDDMLHLFEKFDEIKSKHATYDRLIRIIEESEGPGSLDLERAKSADPAHSSTPPPKLSCRRSETTR